MSNVKGIHFRISVQFGSQAAYIQSLLDGIINGHNIEPFFDHLGGKTIYISFDPQDAAKYLGKRDLSGELFYDEQADGTPLTSSQHSGPASGEKVLLGMVLVQNELNHQAALVSASPTGQLDMSLSRVLFHELAHAETTRSFTYHFNPEPTHYAAVEAIAIAAENLIYAKDHHLPSRVGHIGGPGSFNPSLGLGPSFDPALPFRNVASVFYSVREGGPAGLAGMYYGKDQDQGTIFKLYNKAGDVQNVVTVGGFKQDLVTDAGGLSLTFRDAMSGMLADASDVRVALAFAGRDLAEIRAASAALPQQAAGSAVANLLVGMASVRLGQVTTVVGNSNERFTDTAGQLFNYVGPVNDSDGSPHLGLRVFNPSIIIGASGFRDPGKKIDFSNNNESLTGAAGGTNILIAGSGHGPSANILTAGSGNDILIGGSGPDEIHAENGGLVIQSGGEDIVFGSGSTIFAAGSANTSPTFDTSTAHGTTVDIVGPAGTTSVENVHTFMGNQYRTTFIGNGRTPEVFIAGAGGGDFTLKNGDVAIGNPNVTNIYRLSSALVNGAAPTVSILNLGPKDIILIDGVRFNGNVHTYSVRHDSQGLSYVVNEHGTSTWGTVYPTSELRENSHQVETVRPFSPVSDLPGALEYLHLWGLDTPDNITAITRDHFHHDTTFIYYTQAEVDALPGYSPPPPIQVFFMRRPDGAMATDADYEGFLPGPPLLVHDQSDILMTGDQRRDVAYVLAHGDPSTGTIVLADTTNGVLHAGLNISITGFQNGVSAGLTFSTNDLTFGSSLVPGVTGQFGPNNADWQHVYQSLTAGGSATFINLSTPASSIGQPFNPISPTRFYDNVSIGGIGDVAGDPPPPPLTLIGDAEANSLAFAGTYSIIVGRGGGDTFTYSLDDNSVAIDELDHAAVPMNRLQLGASIDPASITVVGDGESDLVLLLSDGEHIRLEHALDSAAGETFGVQEVAFADGTIWTYAQMIEMAAAASAVNTHLYGDHAAQTFDPQGIATTIEGGGGGDTIVYNPGYGALTILEIDEGANPSNTLQFGPGIIEDNVRIEGDASGNLILDLGDGDRIVIAGGLANSDGALATYGVQFVSFDDGTVWSIEDVLASLAGSPEPDGTLFGDGHAQLLDPAGLARGVVGGGGGDTIVYDMDYGPLVVNELDTGASPTNLLEIRGGFSADEAEIYGDRLGNLVIDLGGQNQITLVGALLSGPGAARGVQQVTFVDDDVTWTYQDLLQRALEPSADKTQLFGDPNANLIDSLGIATKVTGGGGGDIFAFQTGYGELRIAEADANAQPDNRISLGSGLLPQAVVVNGNEEGDLVLDFGGGDRIIVEKALTSATGTTFGVQQLVFADGTVWSYADLLEMALTPSGSHLDLHGDATANVIDSAGVANSITGGGGGDTFIYDRGYGSLTIVEADSSSTPANVIQLGGGIDPSSLSVTGAPGGDLLLSFGEGDEIILRGGLTSDGGATHGVQQVQFADGSSLDYDDLLTLIGSPSATNLHIYGDDRPNVLDSQGIADTVTGGGGGDTFVYLRGYGQLTIDEADTGSIPDNQLLLGPDILPGDLAVTGNEAGDLILSLGAGDEIHLSKALLSDVDATYGVQEIVFDDGTILSYEDLLALAGTPSSGSAGIYGDTGANVLDGAGIAQLLVGNGGGDTFVFHRGDGAVSVIEDDRTGYGENLLVLGEDISPDELAVTADASGTLILSLEGGDEIRIVGALNNSDGSGEFLGVQQVLFADGTVWSYDALVARIAPSVDGVLYGDAGPQDFAAGAAATIVGRGGGDIFHFDQGQGALVINELDAGIAPYNLLQFGAGIAPSSVTVAANQAGDLVLSLAGADQVTITGGLSGDPGRGLQTISFEDGTVWDIAKLAGLASATLAYELGDEPIRIDEALLSAGTRPALVLPEPIASMDLELSLAPGGTSLTLSFGGQAIAIFDNPLRTDAGTGQLITFSDGTTLTLGDLLASASFENLGSLVGTSGAETFDTHGSVLRVSGDGGGDTFVYQQGYGLLSIDEEGGPTGPDNVLTLGSGLMPADVTVSGLGSDLILNFGGNDQVILEQALRTGATGSYGVEELRFADGTIWSYADLVAHAASPSDGNLTLYGDGDAQTFDPLGMSTRIEGNGGGDTIIYNLGYGPLTISESDPSHSVNTLQLGAGIAPEDVTVTSDFFGNFNLAIGDSDRITITDGRRDSDGIQTGVQQVTFADGTIWGYQDLLARSEVPSESNVILFGDADPQTIDTQGIARRVVGEGGGDTFVYGADYGPVWIQEFDSSGATNRLQLGAGLLPSNVVVAHQGDNVTLTFGQDSFGNDNRVTLEEQLSPGFGSQVGGVQQIIFGDGTVWSRSDLVAVLLAGSTAQGPSLVEGGSLAAAFSEQANAYPGTSNHFAFGNFQFLGNDPDPSDSFLIAQTSLTISGPAAGLPDADTVRSLLSWNFDAPNPSTPGHIFWSFNANDALFDYLGEGDVLTLSYGFSVTDNLGRDLLQPVTITVTGANDAPRLDDTAQTDVFLGLDSDFDPADPVELQGSIAFTDPDLSDLHVVTIESADAFGADEVPDAATLISWLQTSVVEPGADGAGALEWNFNAPTSAFPSLATGGGISIFYTLTLEDSAGAAVSRTISVTIFGPQGDDDDEDELPFPQAPSASGDGSDAINLHPVPHGTEAHDVLAGTSLSDTLAGLGGDDTLSGRGGDDQLDGGTGSDTMSGGLGNDDYVLGAGDDATWDAGGNDVYRYEAGDGDDVIYDAEGVDALIFGPGISPTDVVVSAGADSSYVLTFANMAGSVTLTGAQIADRAIEEIRFADETVWTPVDLAAAIEGPTDHAPVADLPIGPFTSDEDSAIDIALPVGSFVDPDGDALTISAAMADGSPLPEWLVFDGARFTGAPPADFNGTLALTLTASDGTLSTDAPVELTIAAVNDAPIVGQPSQDAHSAEDQAVDLPLPQDLFSDVDGDALTLTATLQDGDPLPAWLAFDGSRFTGTPPANFNGSIALRVTASDGTATASTDFSLIIDPVNDAPQLHQSIADAHSAEDQAVNLLLPQDMFTDVDGDALTLTATLQGGAPLPVWLSFDGSRFTGTPPANFNGSIALHVTASDGTATASTDFSLIVDPVNDAPQLHQSVANAHSAEDQAVNLLLPQDTFTDVDGDILTLTATLQGGNPLPAWLQFDGSRFTGTPPANFNGSIALHVTASDGTATVSADFSLIIDPVNDAPQLHQSVADTHSAEDQAVNLLLPQDMFTDADGDALTLTATLQGGNPLPSWLSFDGSRFTGTPPANFNGSIGLHVTASDGTATASQDFNLIIDPVNDAPQLQQLIADAIWRAGVAQQLPLPSTTFSDVDGDSLAVSAALANGSALPAWLSFDPATMTFSGTGPSGTGVLAIRVTASDGHDSASDLFNLAVAGSFASTITGTSANNSLTGTSAAEEMDGLGGDDTLNGAAGNDLLDGGVGNDRLIGGAGADMLIGGDGFDWADYTTSGSALTLDLYDGSRTTGDAVGDIYVGIESYVGTSFADTFYAGPTATTFDGGTSSFSVPDTVDYSLSTAGVTITLNVPTGSDPIVTGSGAGGLAAGDQFYSIERFVGTSYNDVYIVTGGPNVTSIVFVEAVNGGIDEVRTDRSFYTLGSNLEKLTYIGTGNFTGTGNSLDNVLTGGAGADRLIGGAGHDTLIGGAGFDYADYSTNGAALTLDLYDGSRTTGQAVGDIYNGIEGYTGSNFADTFIAGATATMFDGGSGGFSTVDTVDYSLSTAGINLTLNVGPASDLTGTGTGGLAAGDQFLSIERFIGTSYDDVYTITGGSDVGSVAFVEAANGGTDEVRTGVSFYTLGSNLEKLTYIGTGNFTGTGNSLDNVLTGGAGADRLIGGAGHDTLIGGAGFDYADYSTNGAALTLDLYDGSRTTGQAVGDIYNGIEGYTGSNFADTFIAGAAATMFDGGSGGFSTVDTVDYSLSTAGINLTLNVGPASDLTGTGTGGLAAGDQFLSIERFIGTSYDDVYTITGGSDVGSVAFVEAANGGTDEVRTGVHSYTLGSNIEKLTYIGTSTFTGTGNGLDNVLTGGAGDDHLIGGVGADTLIGGAGFDYADYSTNGAALTLDLYDGSRTTGQAVGDTYSGIEGYVGTNFADTFIAGATATAFDGGSSSLSVPDTVDYSLSTAGISLTLSIPNASSLTGTGAGGLAAGDQFTSIERFIGTSYDDVYTITGGSDVDSIVFVEAANGGTDEVRTGVHSYTLGSNIEKLTYTGTSTFTGTGNSLDNFLTGASGADRLIGGAGNDTLIGGAGTDVAVFSGLQASYSIVTNGGSVQIVDNQPGTDGNDGTDTVQGIETAEFKNGVQVSISSPIVLDLDGDGAELIDRSQSMARFDWNGDGRRDATGWVGHGDGFLTLDRDHDGTVSGASELSFVDDKVGAKSDLDGLSAFDSNHDGRLSGADDAWGSFHVWRDGNGNGAVDAGEYLSMSEAGVAAINLAGTATARSWGWSDNIVINDGAFVRTDGTTAALADVALNYVASPAAPAPAHYPVDWAAELWGSPARFHLPDQRGALIDLDADLRHGLDRGGQADRADTVLPPEEPLEAHSAVLAGDGSAGSPDPAQARGPALDALDPHLAFGDDGLDFMAALGAMRGPGWVQPLDAPMSP